MVYAPVVMVALARSASLHLSNKVMITTNLFNYVKLYKGSEFYANSQGQRGLLEGNEVVIYTTYPEVLTGVFTAYLQIQMPWGMLTFWCTCMFLPFIIRL